MQIVGTYRDRPTMLPGYEAVQVWVIDSICGESSWQWALLKEEKFFHRKSVDKAETRRNPRVAAVQHKPAESDPLPDCS